MPSMKSALVTVALVIATLFVVKMVAPANLQKQLGLSV